MTAAERAAADKRATGGSANKFVSYDANLCAEQAAAAGPGGGGESCSCLEGNPCVDRYVCLDWENRFAVAKANGMDKGKSKT